MGRCFKKGPGHTGLTRRTRQEPSPVCVVSPVSPGPLTERHKIRVLLYWLP